MNVTVSLIVVNYRTPGDVGALLASLDAHPPSVAHEVIVVNSAPEGAFAWPAGRPGGRALNLVENRGYGTAVNAGVAAARGEFLLAMNADILFRNDCLNALVARMRAAPRAGLLAPRLVGDDGALQYNVRRFYTPLTIACRRTPLGRLLPGVVRHHLLADRDHERGFAADWALGAALLARRELLESGRLFDERFFLYFEDVDLCARAWRTGWRVEYCPEATLIHRHRRDSAARPWSRSGRAHLASLWHFWRKYGTLRPPGAETAGE